MTEVTTRDIARNYNTIFSKVQKTDQPTIVVSHKKPQVAIISLDTLEQLQRLKHQDSAKSLLDFAKQARGILKDEKLPKDLASKHDAYLWEN